MIEIPTWAFWFLNGAALVSAAGFFALSIWNSRLVRRAVALEDDLAMYARRIADELDENDRLRSRLGPIPAPHLVNLGDPSIAARLQELTVNANAPEGVCGVCGFDIKGANLRLEMTERSTGEQLSVTVCRFCLAEHMPDLLHRLETESG